MSDQTPPLTDTDVTGQTDGAPAADPGAGTTPDGGTVPEAQPDGGTQPAPDAQPDAQPAGTDAPSTPTGEVVERVQIEGTQIDSADGIRKPADAIDAPDAPNFGAQPTAIDGVEVLRDTVTTQIAADGKRYPINPNESAPTARHNG